jgi:hypothetical protein
MPTFDATRLDGTAGEEDRLVEEVSAEPFDRLAFAQHALDLLRPRRMTIAVCEGVYRLRVQAGRVWGAPAGERWAIVSVPPTASRRAIALAVTQLVGTGSDPYVLDVLLSESGGHAYRG